MQPAQAAQRGRWLPPEVTPFTGGLTAAQRAEAMAKLRRFEQLVKAIPELANPDGFEILPIISGGARQQDGEGRELPGTIVEYGVSLLHFYPTRAIAGEGSACVAVSFNGRQSGRLRDANGREIYIEGDRGTPSTKPTISDSRVPQKAVELYGALWNVAGERSGVTVMYVSAGELPWKPVSREEFYKANLLDLEGARGEKLAGFREGLQKTPYEEWMAGAAQRKKDRDEAAAQLKGIVSEAEIEKFRQRQEATERDVAEQLKKAEATHKAQNSEAFTKSFERRDNMNAELARMSSAERAMPTYINNALGREGYIATGWTLTDNDAPPAWRVFTPNLDFYRPRRSPVEVRSVTVTMTTSFTCNRPKIREAIWKAYHSLDWNAINQLLESPR
jgi:hypothetical protein